MFMYLNESYNDSSISVEPIMSTSYTPDGAGAMTIVSEMLEDYGKIQESMFFSDVKEMRAHLSESSFDVEVIQENAIKKFLTSAKNMFIKLFQKVKGMFENFKNYVQALVSQGAKFTSKFSKLIEDKERNGDYKNFEYTGFKWSINDSSDNNYKQLEAIEKEVGQRAYKLVYDSDTALLKKTREDYLKDAKAQIDSYEEEVKKIAHIETARGKIVGGGRLDDKEYGEKLFRFFRGDEVKPTQGIKPDIKEMIKVVKERDKNIKAIQNLEKDTNKYFTDKIKEYDKLEKEAGKYEEKNSGTTSYKQKVYSIQLGVAKRLQPVALQYTGAKMRAVKSRYGEYKNVLTRLVTYKSKSESFEVDLCSELVEL